MFLRHGKVIAEGWWNPYRPDLKHILYSTSKTFTSTAVGFAVSEGRLTVDDKVISFFPDLLPDTVSDNLAALRVKDLLCMAAGQNPEPFEIIRGQQWVKSFLAAPIVDEPGTKFLYNSVATYMLSAIIQKTTGEKLIDYLTPRLFEPLSIKDADWEIDSDGVNTGGWGLRVKTEDMAKLGLLYLQKGKWNNQQLLPEKWINEATTAKIMQNPDATDEEKATNDWVQGYCYQIWRCRHNAFRADGAFGQFIIVMPEQDVVVAITANVNNMQEEIDLVWEHLLPAIHSGQLPADQDAASALRQKLASLALPPAKGTASSIETQFSSETVFKMDNSKTAFSFLFRNDVCYLTMTSVTPDYQFEFGKETWRAGETTKPCPYLVPSATNFVGLPPFKVSGSYCWDNEQTLTLTLRYIETPHYEMYTFRFDGKQLTASFSNSFNPDQKIEMTGKKN
jgi:CubicO group peptidase (beta-lactamase class C family)